MTRILWLLLMETSFSLLLIAQLADNSPIFPPFPPPDGPAQSWAI